MPVAGTLRARHSQRMSCIDVTLPPVPTKINKLLLVVAAVVWDADGRVLIGERPADKIYPGWWEFPGGKIEAGETPEASLVRELDEELGLKTHVGCLHPLTFVSHNYPEFHVLLPVFSIRQWSGDLTGREGQRFAWVKPNELRAYQLLPTAEKMMAAIHDAAVK